MWFWHHKFRRCRLDATFFALSLGVNWNNYYLLEGIADTTHGGTNKNHYRPHKYQLSMEGSYFKKYVFWEVFFLSFVCAFEN